MAHVSLVLIAMESYGRTFLREFVFMRYCSKPNKFGSRSYSYGDANEATKYQLSAMLSLFPSNAWVSGDIVSLPRIYKKSLPAIALRTTAPLNHVDIDSVKFRADRMHERWRCGTFLCRRHARGCTATELKSVYAHRVGFRSKPSKSPRS